MNPISACHGSLGLAGYKKFLPVLCACVLIVILFAGLWPFGAPKNQVTWADSGDALIFRYPGTAIFRRQEQISWPNSGSAWTFQIWLKPAAIEGETTFFSFFDRDTKSYFSFCQSQTDLLLLSRNAAPASGTAAYYAYVNDIFERDRREVLTVVYRPSAVEIYRDGEFVRALAPLRVPFPIRRAEWVLGTSPVNDDSWPGEISALAVYASSLSAETVHKSYRAWTGSKQFQPPQAALPVVVYVFRHNTGRLVHNSIQPGAGLEIPPRFELQAQTKLASPRSQFRPDWSYWKDVLLNVAGFVPLGFFFCTFWASRIRLRAAASLTLLLGLSTTLAIETLQSYLPTRHSDCTDVLANSAGTCVGVFLYLVPALALGVLRRFQKTGMLASA